MPSYLKCLIIYTSFSFAFCHLMHPKNYSIVVYIKALFLSQIFTTPSSGYTIIHFNSWEGSEDRNLFNLPSLPECVTLSSA